MGRIGGCMARKAKDVLDEAAAPAAPADALPLPFDLPAAMFTGPGLLTLADLVPVMTGFVDRELRYRFMNKALGDWLERPRREMVGRHMREVIGERAFADREPMLKAA